MNKGNQIADAALAVFEVVAVVYTVWRIYKNERLLVKKDKEIDALKAKIENMETVGTPATYESINEMKKEINK